MPDLDVIASRLVTVARRRGPRAGATRVVALDGPSGSGKTTLAAAVVRRLADEGERPVGVRMDDLYPGWDGLAEGARTLAHDVLVPLAHGRHGSYHRWDWERDEFAERHEILHGTRWLVVDGVGSGSAGARPYLAALAWLDGPPALRKRRALERDGDAYRPWWDRWTEQERCHFAADATQDHADVRVDAGG